MSTTQTAAVETFAFRVVVRGNVPAGQRIRAVRNVQCAVDDITPALAACDAITAEITKDRKLSNVFSTVYPPVGYKCNGALSKGWHVAADGSIERVRA